VNRLSSNRRASRPAIDVNFQGVERGDIAAICHHTVRDLDRIDR